MVKIKSKVIDNSAKQIHQFLLDAYVFKTLEIEMQTYKARQTRLQSKAQRYFNSTPLRNAFARWMTYAVYANRWYTITELVDDMHTNRQSISTIINDCEAEKWIDVVRNKNSVRCQGTQLLVDNYLEYAMWRKELTKSTIGTAFNALDSFEFLMQTDLALNTEGTANSQGIDNSYRNDIVKSEVKS
tara:strand:- start:583 stop:1140 length:558 start_codon:yes stop_codon:yes gene_type:complete